MKSLITGLVPTPRHRGPMGRLETRVTIGCGLFVSGGVFVFVAAAYFTGGIFAAAALLAVLAVLAWVIVCSIPRSPAERPAVEFAVIRTGGGALGQPGPVRTATGPDFPSVAAHARYALAGAQPGDRVVLRIGYQRHTGRGWEMAEPLHQLDSTADQVAAQLEEWAHPRRSKRRSRSE